MSDSRSDSFESFFATATGGFTPYAWQMQVALDGLPDILPIPTGLGKTEVVLAWAWRLLVEKEKPEPLHLVVCLLMRSLATSIVQRLRAHIGVPLGRLTSCVGGRAAHAKVDRPAIDRVLTGYRLGSMEADELLERAFL